ncbi:hypothetical protein MA16_Dca020862 [Dendrobium catenatum]|uniref:Uncharacterized protein n=1 Tax=Dendrobium catenatum TaxID=906689 RepID=A0A2I0X6V0_9ASPA|nr:hypothetical protein MA16_Dca020862 [Dendrobium catenatum]
MRSAMLLAVCHGLNICAGLEIQNIVIEVNLNEDIKALVEDDIFFNVCPVANSAARFLALFGCTFHGITELSFNNLTVQIKGPASLLSRGRLVVALFRLLTVGVPWLVFDQLLGLVPAVLFMVSMLRAFIFPCLLHFFPSIFAGLFCRFLELRARFVHDTRSGWELRLVGFLFLLFVARKSISELEEGVEEAVYSETEMVAEPLGALPSAISMEAPIDMEISNGSTILELPHYSKNNQYLNFKKLVLVKGKFESINLDHSSGPKGQISSRAPAEEKSLKIALETLQNRTKAAGDKKP